MSFAINPSLNHIDIPESCVYELFRSQSEVLLPDARFHGHTSEAYICIAKIEKTVKAYIALLEMEMKSVFVYTSDYSVSDPAFYPEVYAEAEAFVKKMGFVMEPVNLGFSPAMREVIIKGFRVMRPPPPKKPQLRQTKVAPVAEPRKLRDTRAFVSGSPVLPEAPGDLATELVSLQRELASAKAAIAQITRDKVSLEQSAALEIASLKASCEQAVEAKRKGAEMFAAETEKLRQEERSRTGALDDEEKSALRADLERLTAAAKADESRLHAEISSLQHRTGQLENDKLALEQQLTQASAANAEQVRLLAEEKSMLLSRIAAEESAAIAVADKIATLELFETSWKEGQQREEDLCRNLDLMHKQLDTLTAELQTYKERGPREEALTLRVNNLEQALEAAKAEIATAAERVKSAVSVTDELKLLQEEKAAIETEYVRFANEIRDNELEMLDNIAAAEAEVERLSSELEIQTQVAALEHAALRAELRKMILSGATAVTSAAAVAAATAAATAETERELSTSAAVAATVSRDRKESTSAAVVPAAVHDTEPETALPPEPAASAPFPADLPVKPAARQCEAEALDETDDEPDRPIVADKSIVSRLMNEFGGFSGSSGSESTEFSIDPDLTAVAYSDPEEIEALLYSVNTVQAVPDSSNIQRCKGYVVATKKEGSYKVYVAWYLTESRRVVVCTPQQQPADSDECVRVLLDAVAYFEIVGFMMEIAELGETVHSYNKTLRKTPALCRAAKA